MTALAGATAPTADAGASTASVDATTPSHNNTTDAADEIFVHENGDAVLIYEQDDDGEASTATGHLGLNVTEGLMHVLVRDELDATDFFDVSIEQFEWSTYIGRVLSGDSHRSDAMMALGWSGGWDPDTYLRPLFYSEQATPACCNAAHYANDEVDPQPVPTENVVGVVQFHIPLIGHVISFASSDAGLLVFVILPATGLAVSEVVSLYRDATASGDESEEANSANGTSDVGGDD